MGDMQFDHGAQYVTAQKAGVVQEVSADVVTIQLDEGGTQDYFLRKFDRSNQGTSYNQRVIVSAGDRIEVGEVTRNRGGDAARIGNTRGDLFEQFGPAGDEPLDRAASAARGASPGPAVRSVGL